MLLNKEQSGFTTIEIIVVVVIIGIVYAASWGWRGSLVNIRVKQAAFKLAADIRCAQSYALASQNRTRVVFDVLNDSYSLSQENSGGGWTALSEPGGGGTYTVNFRGSEYSGTDIVSLSLGTVNNALVFDKRGVPYGQNSATGYNATLASQGLINLNEGVNITIQPQTGRVDKLY